MGIHDGHRSRVKEKIAKSGLESFADHEVLEALLFYAIPYRDTNPIAHDLLDRAGNLNALLYLPATDIAAVKGCGDRTAEFLMLFAEAGRRAFVTAGYGTLYNNAEVMSALALRTVAHTEKEVSYFMLFDNRFSLLETRLLFDGYFASAAVRANLIAEPALRLHASSVVIVTHHKSRVACPDRYEMETIRYLQRALEQIGIHLLEYYVVGGNLIIPILKNHKTTFPLCIASAQDISDEEQNPYHEVLPDPSPYAASMTDEEILTSLFEYLMPHDHGETIHRLLRVFPTLSDLLCADDDELLTYHITPHALSFLRLLLPAYGRCLRTGYDHHVFRTAESRGAYFTSCFAGLGVEAVHLMMLDEEMRLVECRRMATGSTNSANLNTRALVEAAMFSGARYVSLAHNHPKGNTTPSEADRRTTEMLTDAFSTVGVTLTEHFTIAGNLYAPILSEKGPEEEA